MFSRVPRHVCDSVDGLAHSGQLENVFPFHVKLILSWSFKGLLSSNVQKHIVFCMPCAKGGCHCCIFTILLAAARHQLGFVESLTKRSCRMLSCSHVAWNPSMHIHVFESSPFWPEFQSQPLPKSLFRCRSRMSNDPELNTCSPSVKSAIDAQAGCGLVCCCLCHEAGQDGSIWTTSARYLHVAAATSAVCPEVKDVPMMSAASPRRPCPNRPPPQRHGGRCKMLYGSFTYGLSPHMLALFRLGLFSFIDRVLQHRVEWPLKSVVQ